MEDTEELKVQGDTDKQMKVCVRKTANEANKVKPRAHCEKEVEKCMEFVLQYLRSTRPTTGQSVKDTNKYGSWE